jgi:hypothetical protein
MDDGFRAHLQETTGGKSGAVLAVAWMHGFSS